MRKVNKVFKIGVCKKNSQKIDETNEVEVLSNKGILGDRHFHDSKNHKGQITLIEKENIDYYNNKYKTEISYINFRRNIITESIKLNDLVGKEFFIGKVKLKAHDLCRPCKYLQNKLNQNNFVKEFLLKGGLRCEILISGKILVGDKIIY